MEVCGIDNGEVAEGVSPQLDGGDLCNGAKERLRQCREAVALQANLF